jgi:CO/xanthine dehydrogenase Mo-binding subunit
VPSLLDTALHLSRRAFLKAGGALVVTFTIAPRPIDAQSKPAIDKSVDPDDVGAFLAIDAKGMVTLYSGKVELGTGALTALTQIAAEELSVPFGRVAAIQGDTALTPNQGPTYASLSIQDGGMQIRRAAATAREALLEQAASKLGLAKGELAVRDGVITPRNGGKGLTYGELVGGRKLTINVNPAVALKDPRSTRSSASRCRGSTFRRRSSAPSTSCKT